MAFHHPGAALLVLSALLGILGSLHAYTPLIPLDQLTIEEVYLEHYLIDHQLRSANPPNMTAEQKAIFDRLYRTGYGIFKPNDPLSSSFRQMMTEFRQAFKNWEQPLKRGTIEYLLTRALGQSYLYQDMVKYFFTAVTHKHKGYQKAFSRAKNAVNELYKVYNEVKKKNDNSSSLVKPEDVKKLEVAIETARDAVMAMPRIDENGEPETSSSSLQSTSSGILPEESPDEPDADASLPAAEEVEDTPLIPLEELTVEQAYMEHYLIDQQLRSKDAPSITAEQKDIYDRLCPISVWHYSKPNDQLPSSLYQMMSTFRQAFTNWKQPLKPGTAEYELTRGFALFLLYDYMIKAVDGALMKKAEEGVKHHQDQHLKTLAQARNAKEKLYKVYIDVQNKFDNSVLKEDDLDMLEVAIKTARNAVMAMPKFDENGVLMISGSKSSKQTTSSTLLLPKKSANEKPDGPVESSGEFSFAEQVKDSARGDGDPVEPNAVPPRPGSPIVSSGVDPAGPDEQLPSGSAGRMPGGWSSLPPPRKSRNNLFYLLKRPFVWGSALVLALAGGGYYFLRGHPASSTLGDLYSMSTSTLNFAFVASEGSSPFLYILPLGGLVALVALGYGCWYWCYNKTDGEAPREEKTKASKRASKKKSRRLSPTTTGTPSSPKTTSAARS